MHHHHCLLLVDLSCHFADHEERRGMLLLADDGTKPQTRIVLIYYCC